MTKNSMNNVEYSDDDWLEEYPKERTRACAKTSLNIFDQFCQNQTGLNGKSKDTLIEQYKLWFKPKKQKDEDGDNYYPEPNIQAICLSLKKFVKFMQEPQDLGEYVNSITSSIHGGMPMDTTSYFL